MKHQVEAVRDYEIGTYPEDEVDFVLPSTDQLVSPNVSMIPQHNAVQPARAFYGARFTNQAQPVVNNEAPLVQTSMTDDPEKSFDEHMGSIGGAVRADSDGVVASVTDNAIVLRSQDGKTRKVINLYKHHPFNRYSGLTQTPVVQLGQVIKPNDLLARSNFTDAKGTMALGLNARVGVVPFKGYSMDDATAVSQSFANRATSQHIDTLVHDFSNGDLKGGVDHFRSLFPQTFTRDQLDTLDAAGVVKPGQIVQPGDPIVLATRPRNFNSAQSASLARLGKVARELRADASLVWDKKNPGVVRSVVRKKDGTAKVIIESHKPLELGDKIALRSGQKSIVSKIIPDNEMPRTADGKPLEVLLNQQGIPSRANPSLIWEILLGKVAAAKGAPIKLPAFNGPNNSWVDYVEKQLKGSGLTDKEVVFDPKDNRRLDRPITVGNAYVLKLHHVAEKKLNSRGQASYDADQQPARGGGAGAGAKRRSGLETVEMLSSGAVANLRESSTLTGQQNDDFWRQLRAGQSPKPPGAPFVWTKFQRLLNGAGMHARDLGDGRLRLGFMTDKNLNQYRPITVRHGRTINFKTLEPEEGGLFSSELVGGQHWGAIDLPEPMPNPAAEESLRHLLNLSKREFDAVLAGEKHLEI